MNVDGTDPHPITYTTGSGLAFDGVEAKWSSHGSFSPDGTRIAYSSTESGRSEIWVMNSDGRDQHQLTFPDDPNIPDANNPTWSPDGEKIVYFGGLERGRGFIFTMNPDGSDQTQLTSRPSDDPSWSPDGQQILFDAARSDGSGFEASIMNRDGTGQRVLSSTPLYPSRVPAISKLLAEAPAADWNAAQPIGFDFQDIAPPASPALPQDISAASLNDFGTAEGGNAVPATDLESIQRWDDAGDGNGCADGCW